MPGKLILVRHGQSIWNVENLFTGWHDVDLSDQGRKEAAQAGRELLKEKLAIDIAFTSVLKRAIRTLWIMLDEMDRMWIPGRALLAAQRAALRRAAGTQQGADRGEARRGAGEDLAPQLRHSAAGARARAIRVIRASIRATPSVDVAELPAAESLKDTLERVLPYWHSRIAPELRAGRNVLVAAHGNSLRAMVKMLDNVPEKDIVELNIPTGVPLLYELDAELKPLGSRYLGDPAAIAAAAEAVRRQTEKK